MTDHRTRIESSLQAFTSTPLRQASLDLLATLGYRSDKTIDLEGSKPQTFIKLVEEANSDATFDQKKALFTDWKSADLLFQLTDDEISGQASLFKDVRPRLLQSYLFFAIELTGNDYARGKLTAIARQINRVFPMPVMVLIKHLADKQPVLSIAVINRRRNKTRADKDVLEKTTIIRDISLTEPHRGHKDILNDLALDNLVHPQKLTINNFDALHTAWEKIFNVELLNNRFYKELSNWYFWALRQVEFPADLEPDDEKRRATGLIRLLTRLVFCWFLKEKGLIPDKLFHTTELAQVLKGFDPKSEDDSNYYQAILQNLFFATLNQRMGKPHRKFAKDEGFHKNRNTHDVNNLFRYEKHFDIPEEEALALFAQIPFLNGGLFECLDRRDEDADRGKKALYLDGFSRNAKKRPKVPNHLFFSEETTADLSKAYGDNKRKKEPVTGLINILNGYKFTIVENTPIDQEIALDPELLGKVFENLLASYNEETKTTARKQTGSFYTPRPIVDYMVDESLKAHFTRVLVEKTDMQEGDAEAGLDILFTYTEQEHAFTPAQVAVLIPAIYSCKILDPACGSGAFPMGVLHKLVYILGKLDPGNKYWKQTQLDKLDSAPMREELERIFADNDDDYGRKFHLIRNCLYGVDIQPIAIQISKLRFFISLVCDQQINRKKDNLGIIPLPNLETKFVAANSLIGLDRVATKQQFDIHNPHIKEKERKLNQVRDRYFNAKTLQTKRKCQEQDEELRNDIAELLISDGWGNSNAQKIARWNPYDQSTSTADWFDPERMFGINEGFDVVIGNPPYGANIDALLVTLRLRYQGVIQNYADSFKMFFQAGLELAAPNGILAYISPNVFLSQPRYKDLRQYLLRHRIKKLVNLGEDVFDQVVVPVCLSFISNESVAREYEFADLTAGNKFSDDFSAITYQHISIAQTVSSKDLSLYACYSLKAGQVSFGDALEIKDAGIQYHRSGIGLKNKGGNDLYERLFSSSSSHFSKSRPVWYGRLIDRYWIQERTDEFFNLSYKEILKENESASFTLSAFSTVPKIIWRQTASCLRATIDHDARWFRNTIQCAFLNATYADKLDIYYVLGVANSRFISYTYNKLVKEAGRVFPQVKLTHVKKLPLVVPANAEQIKVADLVRKILRKKQANPAADTSTLEHEIDQHVYQLYQLTPDEIKTIEST